MLHGDLMEGVAIHVHVHVGCGSSKIREGKVLLRHSRHSKRTCY